VVWTRVNSASISGGSAVGTVGGVAVGGVIGHEIEKTGGAIKNAADGENNER